MYQPVIRAARISEVDLLHELIRSESFRPVGDDWKGFLLYIPKPQLKSYVEGGRFLVLDQDNEAVGCVFPDEYDDIMELRSLVVIPKYRNNGFAEYLIDAVKQIARDKGYSEVYTLTRTPRVFEKYGFVLAEDRPLQKVVKDCLSCPRYENCDEITMMARLK
ncbi:MAG: GNAT family N-acetyltransferase [Candidatus Aenigmarchaeota archaeon]|nr:GNAT family N-acetyltransferase [Candidatus Aenigmarchaeota archaeon]